MVVGMMGITALYWIPDKSLRAFRNDVVGVLRTFRNDVVGLPFCHSCEGTSPRTPIRGRNPGFAGMMRQGSWGFSVLKIDFL